jgi:hypothetical protein
MPKQLRFGLHVRPMDGDPTGVEVWKGTMKCCALPGGLGAGILAQSMKFRLDAGTREADYLQGVLDGITLPAPQLKDGPADGA